MSEAEYEEFLNQVVAFQDGTLDDDALQEFENALQQNPEKRKIYIGIQQRSAGLARLCRVESFETLESGEKEEPKLTIRSRRAAAAAVIGAVVCAISILSVFLVNKNSIPKNGIEISYSNQVKWASSGNDVGGYLRKDRPYRLTAGTIRLAMPGHAIITMAAPASFSIPDATTLNLDYGKLVARLPDPDSSLVVNSGEMKVRDLGTSFGVTVAESGKVDLSVFDGSVQVSYSDSQASKATLLEGQTISRELNKTGHQLVDFSSVQYQDIWPLTIGIDEASHIIEFVPPGPNIDLADLADNHKLFLIPERLNHQLDKPIFTSLTGSGSSWPMPDGEPKRHRIPRGKTVSSYLLMFHPIDRKIGQNHALSGSIAFNRPIAGVIVTPNQLAHSEGAVGRPNLDYQSMLGRYLERNEIGDVPLPADFISISDDGREIYFNLHVDRASDHFRVIVDETE